MKTRFIVTVFTIAAFVLAASAPFAPADEHKKYGMKEDGLEGKFYGKTKMILSNETELGLNESQVKKIKELKMSTKKALIKTDAEIDTLALDVKAAMREDPIDLDAVNKLVDKKYDLKKEKTKTLIAAYASLKGILTKEQKAKIKEICKTEKKKCDMMKGKMMGGGKMSGKM